jgi:OOP family OmpA-OmpF porin
MLLIWELDFVFNNKFGLKRMLDSSFEGKNNSADFDTKYYRVNLQAVTKLR